MSQSTCKVPDARDVTPTLLDIGISSAAATLAATWRVLRSLIRLYKSIGARIVLKNKNSCFRRCIPKKLSEVIYPPNTRVQCCIFPFFIGLIFQLLAIAAGSWVSFSIWTSYVQLKIPNVDDSLAIYHFTLAETDVRVLELSGTIIPPNGSYVSLEQISDRELQAFEMATEEDVFCLSEFEYRSEDFGAKISESISMLPNSLWFRVTGTSVQLQWGLSILRIFVSHSIPWKVFCCTMHQSTQTLVRLGGGVGDLVFLILGLKVTF